MCVQVGRLYAPALLGVYVCMCVYACVCMQQWAFSTLSLTLSRARPPAPAPAPARSLARSRSHRWAMGKLDIGPEASLFRVLVARSCAQAGMSVLVGLFFSLICLFCSLIGLF